MSAIANLEVSAKLELYKEEYVQDAIGASNLGDVVAILIGNYKARCSFSTHTRGLPQNENLTEIIATVKAVINTLLDIQALKDIKNRGYFLLKGQKYTVFDFKLSDALGITSIIGFESS
jgi:pantoate kinase